LEWDQWYPRVAQGDHCDIPLLIILYKRFHSRFPGLESPPFATAITTLDIYLRRQLLANTTETTGSIESHCERLAIQIELFIKEVPDDWDARQAEALAWLDLRGQHPEVTADLRERLSRSNVVLQVSGSFFDDVLRRTLERDAPVHDLILGAQISGTSHLVADV